MLLLLVLALAALPAGRARATLLGDAAVSYRANSTVTVNGRSYAGMVFHIPGRDRHEQQIQGIAEVVILDGVAMRGWLVLPRLSSYVEFKFPQLMAELNAQALLRSPVGRETVNGVHTTKYRIDHTAADGMHAKGFAWVSGDGVLMRLAGDVSRPGMSHPTAIELELDNLRLGKQDRALFDLPPGLTRLPGEALAPLLGGRAG
ncbi:MAG TPA: hypothetical protein VF113_08915 [Stellaceae bacterium]